jgi:hypothetical protein
MTEGYQQEAQHALSSGNVVKCIDLLKANVADKDLRQQILQTEIRYNTLRRRMNAGTISSDDAYLEENKISNSLLFIISNLATHTVRSSTPQYTASAPSSPQKSNESNWKWIVLGILGVGLVGIVAMLALRSGPDPAADPCASVRCANGGNCIDGRCFCPDGFTGPRCEQPLGATAGPQTTPADGQGSSSSATTSNSGSSSTPDRQGSTPAAPAPANLVITDFRTDPSPPVQQQAVQVSFVLKNTGETEARDFTVEYWAGENFPEPAFTKTYSRLAAGSTQAVSFRYAGYTSWYGRLRNKIVVDSKDRVRESNEQDNIYQATFSVTKNSGSSSSSSSSTSASTAKPDLRITAFQMKPNPPVKGQRVYMQAIIRNAGNGDAGRFTFQYFPGENYPKPAYEKSFSGLQAGQQQVLSFQYEGYPSHYGRIRNKLVVDSGNQVSESNESNNIYQETLAVKAN